MQQFPATRWSLIVRIRSGDKEESSLALEQICKNYWEPLYNFLRFQGDSHEDAEDHIQGFFLNMLSKDGFATIDLPPSADSKSNASTSSAGTLRSYLLACLKHHRSNTFRNKTALKRGGLQPILSIDRDFADKQLSALKHYSYDPEKGFDRAWALNLIFLVTNRLEVEYERRGKLNLFQSLEPLLAWNDNPGGESYAVIAKRLSISEQSVKNGVHRLRKKLREGIEAEIASTIDEAAGVTVEQELRTLYSILT